MKRGFYARFRFRVSRKTVCLLPLETLGTRRTATVGAGQSFVPVEQLRAAGGMAAVTRLLLWVEATFSAEARASEARAAAEDADDAWHGRSPAQDPSSRSVPLSTAQLMEWSLGILPPSPPSPPLSPPQRREPTPLRPRPLRSYT